MDVRLVPAATAVWATTLLAPLVAPSVLGWSCLATCLLAGLLARRRSRTTALVLALLAGVAVTSATAAVRSAARADSPLRAAAEDGATLTVVLELDGDPHVLGGAGEPRAVVDATVLRLVDRETTYRVRDPVVLFGTADDWRSLLPGQQVRVRVGSSLPQPTEPLVAVLSARGPPTPLGGAGALQRTAGGLREALRDSAQRVLTPPPAGLLPGLVVGDTSAMDPVLEEDFRRAGLAHLTAVFGDSVSCQQ